MLKVEVKFKVKTKNDVREIIQNNLELFHKLDLVGVKNISTAVDYLHIVNTYDQYNWIEDEAKRKETVASQLRITKKTVQNAINLMKQAIELKI